MVASIIERVPSSDGTSAGKTRSDLKENQSVAAAPFGALSVDSWLVQRSYIYDSNRSSVAVVGIELKIIIMISL